jgi:hypothetical protein
LADIAERLKSSSATRAQNSTRQGSSNAFNQQLLQDEIPTLEKVMQKKQTNCWGRMDDKK